MPEPNPATPRTAYPRASAVAHHSVSSGESDQGNGNGGAIGRQASLPGGTVTADPAWTGPTYAGAGCVKYACRMWYTSR